MKTHIDKSSQSKGGFTIIEAVIAIMILAILIPGIYEGIRHGLTLNFLSSQHIAAAGLGREWLEQMRGTPYASVTTNNFETESVILNHIGGKDRLPLNATRSATIEELFLPSRKMTTIDVSWNYRSVQRTEQIKAVIFRKNEAATEGIRGDIAGSLNLNPNNSPDNSFELTLPDDSMITRDDFIDGFSGYTGAATEIRFRPKGNGSQNELILNGGVFTIFNNTTYTIQSQNMNVELYNDNINPQGKAVGKWFINITAANATIKLME